MGTGFLGVHSFLDSEKGEYINFTYIGPFTMEIELPVCINIKKKTLLYRLKRKLRKLDNG